jgi:hypothetical protein
MDPSIYKIIHFIGIIVLFLGLGSLISSDPRKPAALRGPAMIHGIGLFLILLSGFGLQAKLKIDFFTGWFLAKFVIFLLLGAIIVVIKRRLLPTPAIYLIAIILGAIAAYLGFANSAILRL